jgi:ketosteroid isomerase-like protein
MAFCLTNHGFLSREQHKLGTNNMVDIFSASNKVNHIFTEALRHKDSDMLVSLYTTNAIIMPPDSEIIESGKATLKVFFDKLFELCVDNMSYERVTLEVCQDVAYEVGKFTLYCNSNGQNTATRGKHLLIWKCINGAWKIHIDIWNENS